MKSSPLKTLRGKWNSLRSAQTFWPIWMKFDARDDAVDKT